MANRVELLDANIQRVDTLEVLVATVISTRSHTVETVKNIAQLFFKNLGDLQLRRTGLALGELIACFLIERLFHGFDGSLVFKLKWPFYCNNSNFNLLSTLSL